MLRLEEANIILNKIIDGRKTQAATNLALNKKLILDIANVQKLLTAVICTDATNCYNRVINPFTSLYTAHFRLEVIYLLVLFRTK